MTAHLDWRPKHVVVFRYDDPNPARERNHKTCVTAYRRSGCTVTELGLSKASAVVGFQRNHVLLQSLLRKHQGRPVVLDISVFTKRDLLIILRWLDDSGCWPRLNVVYAEPDDYEVDAHGALSFGIDRFRQVPGFAATPNVGRPLHLAVFLGYEGDRALATYDKFQPLRTTLFVVQPSFREAWAGRAERLNNDLIALVGDKSVKGVDGIDPDATKSALHSEFREEEREHARIVCPLGTKPQALGLYCYVRETRHPPAIIYAAPLRHNKSFYSRGIGPMWSLA